MDVTVGVVDTVSLAVWVGDGVVVPVPVLVEVAVGVGVVDTV